MRIAGCRTMTAMVLSVASLWSCGEGPVSDSPEAAVLQFLISSGGLGHFDQVPVYCIGAGEGGEPASGKLLEMLVVPETGRVVPATGCVYSEERRHIVEEGSTKEGVVLWARQPTPSETASLEALAPAPPVGGVVVMVRAGYSESRSSNASFGCWVGKVGKRIVVLRCVADAVG